MVRDKAVKLNYPTVRLASVGKMARIFLLGTGLVFLSSCGEMNPQNVNIELDKSAPVEKITSYSQALLDLGLMSEIYDTGVMRVQSQDIADETGTSVTTGGEIQRNITEIMKSTLNTIGGNIIFIEYDPSYIQNQMVSGYSSFDNKAIPDVVITGGITEFDRGLETRGEGMNADAEVEFRGAADWLPSKTVGASYGDNAKSGKARITLDFNLKDFQTLAGIPRMTTTNSMEVYKGLREEEVGITLFGPTFGLKGTIKKVQGRHEAVRLLVQVSMIQMIGKYLALPYWRLLGDDARPDKVVLDSISATYYRMEREDRIGAVQQWLRLHGNTVDINNTLDAATRAALQKIDPTFGPDQQGISEELFTKIYLTIPVNRQTLAYRHKINEYFANMQRKYEAEAQAQAEAQARAEAKAQAQAEAQAAAQAKAAAAVQQEAAPVVQEQAAQVVQEVQAAPVVQEVAQVQQQVVEAAPAQVQKSAPAKKPKKFGRQLAPDDW